MIYLHGRGTGMAQLARELGISVAFPREGPARVIQRRNIVEPPINWGIGFNLSATVRGILNADTSIARNKVSAFDAFANAETPINHPRWSRSLGELREQIGRRRSVLERQDNLSGGAGIRLVGPRDSVTLTQNEARRGHTFYVEKLSCLREIRIHLWRNQLIARQVKVLPPGNTNFIHSHDNGATFSSHWERWLEPEQMHEAEGLAQMAVDAVGLDFGAVDLMLTRRGRLYVLEVNSAPGIQSDPIREAYRRVLRTMIQRRR